MVVSSPQTIESVLLPTLGGALALHFSNPDRPDGDSRDVAWKNSRMTAADEARRRRADLVAIRRVRDRIDRDYASALNVEQLARGAHMSAGHLSRQFRQVYGESPYSYVMTRRIERAMTLLRRGDLSVTEVCFAVGFSSLGTFSTRFSEYVGVAPSIYREERPDSIEVIPPCLAKVVTRPVRIREARREAAT